MKDFQLDFGSFSKTTVTITPLTEQAKAHVRAKMGSAAVSFEVKKSAAEKWCVDLGCAGFTMQPT